MIDKLVKSTATETGVTYEEAATMLVLLSPNDILTMLDGIVDRIFNEARARGHTDMTYGEAVSLIVSAQDPGQQGN